MNDQPRPTPELPDLAELSKSVVRIAERSQRLAANSIRRQMKLGVCQKLIPSMWVRHSWN